MSTHILPVRGRPANRQASAFSDQIRVAIVASGISTYQLAQRAEVDRAILWRFIHHRGGLSMNSLDRVADVLGLLLVARKRREAKRAQDTSGPR